MPDSTFWTEPITTDTPIPRVVVRRFLSSEGACDHALRVITDHEGVKSIAQYLADATDDEIAWLMEWLHIPGQKEYELAVQHAYATYVTAVKPAQEAYDLAYEAFSAVYEKALAPAIAKHERARKAAQARGDVPARADHEAFDAVQEPLREQFEHNRLLAWERYERARKVADDVYEETRLPARAAFYAHMRGEQGAAAILERVLAWRSERSKNRE